MGDNENISLTQCCRQFSITTHCSRGFLVFSQKKISKH